MILSQSMEIYRVESFFRIYRPRNQNVCVKSEIAVAQFGCFVFFRQSNTKIKMMNVPTNAKRDENRRTSYLSQFKAIFANQREGKKRIQETAEVAQGILLDLYQTVVPVAAKLGENVRDCVVEMHQMQYRSVAEQLQQEQKQQPPPSSRIPINKSVSRRRNSFSPNAATLGQQRTLVSPPPTAIVNEKPSTSSNRRSSRLPFYHTRRTPGSNHSYPPFCCSLSSTGR